MIGRRVAVLALVAAAAPVAGGSSACASEARAPGASRAAIVVQMAPDDVREFCVSFSEPSITGLEALQRTGLDVVVESYGPTGAMVCRIGSVGCDYPGASCTCEYARTGRFWGYYRLDGASWTFSDVGAAQTEVRDGDVHGWRWGAHGATGAQGLRSGGNVDDVCARAASTAAAPSGPAEAPKRGSAVAAAAGAMSALMLALVARRTRQDKASA